jgi:hypothetical protein
MPGSMTRPTQNVRLPPIARGASVWALMLSTSEWRLAWTVPLVEVDTARGMTRETTQEMIPLPNPEKGG